MKGQITWAVCIACAVIPIYIETRRLRPAHVANQTHIEEINRNSFHY